MSECGCGWWQLGGMYALGALHAWGMTVLAMRELQRRREERRQAIRVP